MDSSAAEEVCTLSTEVNCPVGFEATSGNQDQFAQIWKVEMKVAVGRGDAAVGCRVLSLLTARLSAVCQPSDLCPPGPRPTTVPLQTCRGSGHTEGTASHRLSQHSRSQFTLAARLALLLRTPVNYDPSTYAKLVPSLWGGCLVTFICPSNPSLQTLDSLAPLSPNLVRPHSKDTPYSIIGTEVLLL